MKQFSTTHPSTKDISQVDLNNLNSPDDLLLVLAQLKDYTNPFQILGVTPMEAIVETWLNELDARGVLDVLTVEPPMLRLNQKGREVAFRLSLSRLPDLPDEQFIDLTVALCQRRRSNVQHKIAKKLKSPPEGASSAISLPVAP